MHDVEAAAGTPAGEHAMTDSEDDSASVTNWADLNLPDVDDATRQAILTSIRANAASDDDDEEDEELLQLLTNPEHAAAGSEEQRQQASDTTSSDRHAAAHAKADAPYDMSGKVSEVVRSVPDQHSGSSQLSDPQTPNAAANIEDTRRAGIEAGSSAGDVHTSSQSTAALRQDRQQHQSTAHTQLDDDDRDGYRQWDQDYWQHRDPLSVDNATAAAQLWSRIIRTPRKRGKHIIVDVCSAQQGENASSGLDASEGHLVRQIIATTDKRTWLGPAGYRLVRKSRWGDLWPKFYQDYALTQKTG